jgi:hypothetical protein
VYTSRPIDDGGAHESNRFSPFRSLICVLEQVNRGDQVASDFKKFYGNPTQLLNFLTPLFHTGIKGARGVILEPLFLLGK